MGSTGVGEIKSLSLLHPEHWPSLTSYQRQPCLPLLIPALSCAGVRRSIRRVMAALHRTPCGSPNSVSPFRNRSRSSCHHTEHIRLMLEPRHFARDQGNLGRSRLGRTERFNQVEHPIRDRETWARRTCISLRSTCHDGRPLHVSPNGGGELIRMVRAVEIAGAQMGADNAKMDSDGKTEIELKE